MAQDKRFNLHTPVNEQDQRVLKGNSKLNEKNTKRAKKLAKAHAAAASKVETGGGE